MNFAAVALAMLSCLAAVTNATKKSKVCRTRHWPQCALERTEIATNNFSILPTNVPSAEDEISFSLRVYRNGCPTLDTQGLQWYKLEAFAAGTNTSLGNFIEPAHSQRLETYSCRNDSTIIFNTCEPHPMDLPRLFKWTFQRTDNNRANDVCFRLTILDTDEHCKYTESCIALRSADENTSGLEDCSGKGETATSQPGSGARGESVNITEKCHQRWDCSNAKMRLFCGNDGNTYTSRCQIRLRECLTDTDISIEYSGRCASEPAPEPVCHTVRKNLREVFESLEQQRPYWLPTCDCDGLFKPIQCDRDLTNSGHLECWCSYSDSVSAVAGTRRKLVDYCTDPATFEFSCSNT